MRNKGLILTVAATLVVCLGLVGLFVMNKNGKVAQKAPEATVIPAATPATTPTQTEAAEEAKPFERDTGGSFPERGYGNPNAPVRVDEYASLSCSHCADFHVNVFPEFKREFIDTGLVYFVYNDFPTNGPALEGALLSRCMPFERYFQFLDFLFKEQENWAYKQDYSQILRQSAKLLGLSEENVNSCLADDAKKQAIVDHMKKAQDAFGINSTPTFVVNGRDLLRGALPIAEYRKAIEAHLPKER